MTNTGLKSINVLTNIYTKIETNFEEVCSNDLYRGKMGVVIFLYHYSRFINDFKVKEKAHDILEKIWSEIEIIPQSLEFKYGLPGIMYGVDYLFRKDFLPQEDPYLLDEFDYFFFHKKIYHTHLINNDECGFGLALYFINRFDFFFENGDVEKLDLLYHIILSIIDDCENVIASYKFQEKNKHSLFFLSSLIAFIIRVHQRGFNIDKTQFFISQLLQKIKLEREICKQEVAIFNLLYHRLYSLESSQMINLIKEDGSHVHKFDLRMIWKLARLELVQESDLIVSHLVPHNEPLNLDFEYRLEKLDLSFEKGLSGLGYYLIKFHEKYNKLKV